MIAAIAVGSTNPSGRGGVKSLEVTPRYNEPPTTIFYLHFITFRGLDYARTQNTI
jgi:hypothetical protein